MDVVVAGGHGQIGLKLLRLLAERGDRGRGLIRNPDHRADLESAGAEPVVVDMEAEGDLRPFVEGASAIVFAAGAGPGSGAPRKWTVDFGAAAKLVAAARALDIGRFLVVGSIGAQDPAAGGPMQPYLEAKAAADAAVAASGLDYTIVRPGALTDDPGTGRVDLSTQLGRRAPIPRDDVAAILLGCLDEPATVGLLFEAFTGEQPVADALRGLRA